MKIPGSALVLCASVWMASSVAAQTRVGALAVDERQGYQYGWAVDYETSVSAQSAALRECGGGCSVVLTFERCAAYAADQDSDSTAVGWAESYSSSAEAQQAALGQCSSRGGGSGCIVRVWGCNGPVVEEGLRLDRAARREIQEGLQAAGFNPGGADGVFGPRTRSAIRSWQTSRGARATGYLDGASVAALRPSPVGQKPSLAASTAELEGLFWRSIVNTTNPASFEAYLRRFPNGVFTELAQNRLSTLGAEDSTARGPARVGIGGAGSPTTGSRLSGALDSDSRIAAGVDSRSRPAEVFRPDQTCGWSDVSCWVEISGEPGCYIWNASIRLWDPRLTVAWSGECSDGLAQGDGSLTSGAGTPRERLATGRVVDGKQQGHWSERDEDGVREGSYVDGKRQGHWTNFLTTTLLFLDGTGYEGPYVDGERHGRWVSRYGNGEVGGGLYVNGRKQGHWSEINPGAGLDEGRYVDDRRTGHWVVRYEDGRQEGPYVNGSRNGHWVIRQADGTVQEGPYVDAERHGDWVIRWAGGGTSVRRWVNGERGELVDR